MDEVHRKTGIAILQPAQVPSEVLDESCFGDPCCLHALEQAEEQGSRVYIPADTHGNNRGTSDYGAVSSEENHHTAASTPWKCVAIFSYFILIILVGIFGYLSGSVACLTATVHLLSDYLGEHSSSRDRTNNYRRAECIFILFCVIVLLAADSSFMVAAVGRLYVKSFTINKAYMLIAAALSLTANCIMLTLHFAGAFRPRRFLPLTAFIGVRAQQIAHAFGNHGTSLVLFAAAVLLYVQTKWIVADSIATFVLTVAIVSNAASVTTKSCSELKRIGLQRDHYEAL